MWKLVKILEQTYFIYCNFNVNKQEVDFILYDLKETWSQTLTLQQVKQKVKLLNKRFDFSEDNIKEAFTGDCLQTAIIEEQPQTSDIQKQQEQEAQQQQYSCLLKLKYRFKNSILNYEWNLKKQTVKEFQQTFVHPLLLSLMGCHEQIEILKESIRKKDLELNQFRIEGAVLSRKTVATKPFNFEEFTQKYEECNNVAINFKELAKYVKENDLTDETNKSNQSKTVEKVEDVIKPEEKSNEIINNNTKLSPKQKKRKVHEIKKQHLQEFLKRRRQGLEYESSQSQTTSTGNSQSTEDFEEKDLKTKQQPSSSKQVGKANNLTLRKSARCTPTKFQNRNMSSEDKTDDSDLDTKTRSLRERKSTSKPIQNSNNKTIKEESKTIKSENNKNNEKTSRSCARSLNLSYNSLDKSLDKCSESSNVFDFSTDTEDDNSKKNKIKSKRTANKMSSTTSSTVSARKSDEDDTTSSQRNKMSQSKRLTTRADIKSPIVNATTKSKPFTIIPIPIVQLSDTDDDNRGVKDHKNSVETFNSLTFNSLVTISATSSPRSKNLSHSPGPAAINDLSSQLDNIKKELECLEAMRLADLKQRMCKA